ncbi:HEAT repeat domain-containing protein [Legionella quinlivanii]|uniref:HEAT repeat domain-containing protein n=1 Tax=Legionella quinlivanii TaxID=45073 RepID=UPI00224437E1|nr:HEAT repeat domain-containing protein [Legionella quinlivanii]MCW8452416.1 HEAT repeat domain-containing protein [Legionella quinlivanii]
MAQFLGIIKLLVLFQFALIFIFVLAMYFTRGYFHYRAGKTKKLADEIAQRLSACLSEEQELPAKKLREYIKAIDVVLMVLKTMETHHRHEAAFQRFTIYLSHNLLQPAARNLYNSRNWLKRYYAAICLSYGFEKSDEDRLSQLVRDNTLLVSINAASTGIRYQNPIVINQLITSFAKGRHLQQSFFAQISEVSNYDVADIIITRLQIEMEPYTKLFCYRLLKQIPYTRLLDCAIDDLLFDLVDLRIGIIEYLTEVQDERKNQILYDLAFVPQWEVRAAVAKSLGRIHNPRSMDILSILLTDPQWWVRVNSATSLYAQGEAGIDILKAQSPENDKFAYETAQRILLSGNRK